MFDPDQAGFMLGCVSRLCLAAIFCLAALHAARDWPRYAETVAQYRLAPKSVSLAFAGMLPLLQVLAAATLLARPSVGAALSCALLAMFAAAIGINIHRGRTDIDCGCGGADGQRLSWGVVLRNLALMLGAVLAAFAPATGTINLPLCLGIAGSLGFLVTLYFAVNQLLTNAQNLSGRLA